MTEGGEDVMILGRVDENDMYVRDFSLRRTGGYGGIGRRAGFRFQWETVQVQVLLSAYEKCLK